MIFLNQQTEEDIEKYRQYLTIVSSLSDLFSESKHPFLHYRAAENIFCKSFGAISHARGDIAYDAKKNQYGIGIKTFLISGTSKFEKVAEFNSHSASLRLLNGHAKINRLIELRNERIKLADRICETEERIYHCIGRAEGKLRIFETGYDLIDVNSIEIISESDKSIIFKDRFNEYNFNNSKSTIFKKFLIPEHTFNIDIDILKDPLEFLGKILLQQHAANGSKAKEDVVDNKYSAPIEIKAEELIDEEYNDSVVLPLYSPREKKLGREPVPLSSQLNQWNAGGRPRDQGEVYISIPIVVHQKKPGFFPDRDQQFRLLLPSGQNLTAKVCQANNKALMTNPNNALADWLLRKVLRLNVREILTYDHLHELGIDSVRVIKIKDLDYKIEFAKEGSYEDFIELE